MDGGVLNRMLASHHNRLKKGEAREGDYLARLSAHREKLGPLLAMAGRIERGARLTKG